MATNDSQDSVSVSSPGTNVLNVCTPPVPTTHKTSSMHDAVLELRHHFKGLREELSRKEQEMIDKLITYKNTSGNFVGQFVWHETIFTRAVADVCEIELKSEDDCLNKTKPLWEKCSNGNGRNELQGATSLSYDHVDCKLYVADRENGRISIFDKEGRNIRIRTLTDLRPNTPVPELLFFDPSSRLIWLYASDSCHNPTNHQFVAFDSQNLSVKYNVEAISGVITLSLFPHNSLHYFTYNTRDHYIAHGYVDTASKDVKLVPCDTLYLESHHLGNCRKVLGLQTLNDFIFVLYRDILFRILKFDFSGNFCEGYLSEVNFAPVECFCLLSQNSFLLARIGPSPIKQDSQQNLLTPVRKGTLYLQVCVVSPEGEVKDQLALPITPVSEDYEDRPVPYKCSQLFVNNGKLFVLLRGCTHNLIAI